MFHVLLCSRFTDFVNQSHTHKHIIIYKAYNPFKRNIRIYLFENVGHVRADGCRKINLGPIPNKGTAGERILPSVKPQI